MPGTMTRWVVRGVAGLVAAAALAGWLYSSVWTVERNETGLVLRFGKVERTAAAGIHFTLPWPFETMVTVSTGDVRQVSIGFKLMDALNNIPPADDEVQWLTGDTNIIELRAIVFYTRSDPQQYLFGSSIPTADERADGTASGGMLAESERREFTIRKVAESVLTELIAGMTIDQALATGKAYLQSESRRRVQQELDRLQLGATVSTVDIIEVNPPRDVISSFTAVTSAKAQRDQRITEARGERSRTMPRVRAEAQRKLQEAETYRSEVLSRARGEAQRFGAIHAEVTKNRDFGMHRLWLDSMQSILQWVDLKVVPSNGRRTRVYVEE